MRERSTEIKVTVELDENNVPGKMKWNATDGPGEQDCKAMMLSVWDEKEGGTLRVDLWNKDMMVDEMKQFFYQSIMTMADTFERATGEKPMAGEMRDFGNYFAEHMGLQNSPSEAPGNEGQ